MKPVASIKDIPEFEKDNVCIKDEQELLKKINKIIQDGPEKLQIVTDFDHTLTRHTMDNGNAVLTSFGMLRECPSIPQEYKDEDNRLSNYYKPIERDPHMTREEKTKHMVEWYEAANARLRGVIFPRQELYEIGHKMIECFRTGVNDMIEWSRVNQVPVLVFSAGLGESVVAAMDAAKFLLPHVKVVSNFVTIADNGTIGGIKGEIIHTLNKNETAIKNTEYYTLVRGRHNAIVVGDSIGDAGMAEGMDCEAVIKVGFLSQQVQASLPAYLEHFDVVLIDETSFDLLNALLKLVL